MFGSEFHSYDLWWVFPLLMMVLCIVMCIFMMRGRIGPMMCRPGSGSTGGRHEGTSGSALNIISERYGGREINKAGQEEKEKS